MNQISRLRGRMKVLYAEIQDLRKRTEPYTPTEIEVLETIGLELTACSMRLLRIVQNAAVKEPLALEEI